MRHLQRTHGISISWLTEQLQRGEYDFNYCQSEDQAADIFTKPFLSLVKWDHARRLIGHYADKELELAGVVFEQSKTMAAVAQPVPSPWPVATPNRLLIEFCCGSESYLGRRIVYSKGCHVIRITE